MQYYVEPGKSLSTRKGILTDHCEAKPEYFGEGGDKRMKELLEKGILYKAKAPKEAPAKPLAQTEAITIEGEAKAKADADIAAKALAATNKEIEAATEKLAAIKAETEELKELDKPLEDKK